MKCFNHKTKIEIPCNDRVKINGRVKIGGGVTPNPPQKPLPPEPTLMDMAGNFTKATAGWVEAGFPVVSKKEYERRLSICRSCPLWDESARMGYGKCKHKSCGCGKGKLWMGSQHCPDKLW